MLIHLSRTDAILWVIAEILQVLVVVAVHRSQMLQKYWAFCLYIHFAALKTALLMAVPPGKWYNWIHGPWSVVQCVLIVLCIANIYYKTFGPSISLPAWVPRNLKTMMIVAVSVSAATSIIVHPQSGGVAMRAFAIAQQTIVVLAALSLWTLIIYARRLGISWKPKVAQLAVGFVLMLTVNSGALAVAMIVKPWQMAWRVGVTATIFAVSWWSWHLWEKEPAPGKVTHAVLAEIMADFRETEKIAADLLRAG